MAIVFDSDAGTITGISVGGLPDGVVDAGTLATNAVTAAKLTTDSVTAAKIAANSVDSAELIDGAVDNSHIGALAASKLTGALPAISGASLTGFTDAQMPAGSVIQVVQGTPKTSQTATTTTGSWVNAGVSASLTPSSSSNKIIIVPSILAGTGHSSTHTRAMFTVQRSIGGGSYSIVTDWTTTDGGGNVYGGMEIGNYGGATEINGHTGTQFLDSPNTTSECTYLIYIRTIGGYGTAQCQKGSSMQLMEIVG